MFTDLLYFANSQLTLQSAAPPGANLLLAPRSEHNIRQFCRVCHLQDSRLLLLLSAPGWPTSRELALGSPTRLNAMLLSLEPTAAT